MQTSTVRINVVNVERHILNYLQVLLQFGDDKQRVLPHLHGAFSLLYKKKEENSFLKAFSNSTSNKTRDGPLFSLALAVSPNFLPHFGRRRAILAKSFCPSRHPMAIADLQCFLLNHASIYDRICFFSLVKPASIVNQSDLTNTN